MRSKRKQKFPVRQNDCSGARHCSGLWSAAGEDTPGQHFPPVLALQHPSSLLHHTHLSTAHFMCPAQYRTLLSLRLPSHRAGHGIWSNLAERRGKWWDVSRAQLPKPWVQHLFPPSSPHREGRPLERPLWKRH